MGLYARYVLPKVVDFTCGTRPSMRQREKVVPRARGRVLEIGAGSGLNLAYYDPSRVERLFALEPSSEMWAMAEDRVQQVRFPVELVAAGAESVPLETDSVDTVVVTYSLCSVPGVELALSEIRRVLRAGGPLLFCEHGIAPDESVRKWQARINPIWKRLGGGCHLNRDIPALIAAAGFRIEEQSAMYLPGPRVATYNYWGVARGESS